MLVNSPSSDDSLLHSNHSSNNSHIPPCTYSFFKKKGSLIFSAYCMTNILLLLPLCSLVFYVGLQRWRQQRSTSTTATSHSDIFTYHLVIMDLFGVLGQIICCCGIYRNCDVILVVGLYFWTLTWYGEIFFHALTCVERYLAVVHPITYLSLRGERGIRIRNISIGCVWLLCFGGIGLMTVDNVTLFVNFFLVVFFFIIIVFCSISVLCVLIRPKPGEQGKVDQSKLRAFYTILAILVVLLLRLVWTLIWAVLSLSHVTFMMALSGVWFNLPSSLVLPLLFLHRAGIFACCKDNTK